MDCIERILSPHSEGIKPGDSLYTVCTRVECRVLLHAHEVFSFETFRQRLRIKHLDPAKFKIQTPITDTMTSRVVALCIQLSGLPNHKRSNFNRIYNLLSVHQRCTEVSVNGPHIKYLDRSINNRRCVVPR